MLTFKDDLCKGCDLCVWACPKQVLYLDKTRVNAKGYNPAAKHEDKACSTCGVCAKICPDSAITVTRGDY